VLVGWWEGLFWGLPKSREIKTIIKG